MTSTLAPRMVPAAVVIIGNRRGRVFAASSTALYPAMDAMEDSASMLCARVMRGMNSIENSVAPARANCAARSGSPRGSQNPITAWRWFSPGDGLGTRTWSRTWARSRTSAPVDAICAPFAAYSSSSNPASVPAPRSTSTSTPALASKSITRGVIATRRSSAQLSLRTPTVNPNGYDEPLDKRRNRRPEDYGRSE